MGYQPAINICSVETVFWNGGTYSENVYHYKTPAPMPVSDMNDLAMLLRTWWQSELVSTVPATIFLSKIIIKDLTVQNGPGIEFTAGLPLPGGNVVDPLPMNCTVSVKWITGIRGRSYRGRTYHVGIGDFAQEGDKIKAETRTTLEGAYSALLAVKLDPDDPGWVVLSRWQNMLPRPVALGTVITGCTVDDVIDSQRRRLLGRGR